MVMRNPFTREPMISVNSGSLADYFRNGGTPENIFKDYEQYACSPKINLDNIKIGQHARLKFEWPDRDVPNAINEIQVWVLRIGETGVDYDDFRWFYSSQGIQEEKILRGLNE